MFFQFNFVGKLLGPKGNSLKRLQEDTITKMAILGRGSMRDRNKVDTTYWYYYIVLIIISARVERIKEERL